MKHDENKCRDDICERLYYVVVKGKQEKTRERMKITPIRRCDKTRIVAVF